MGEYIRGKKAYTKWDADSENIDIEYRPDAQKGQTQENWLSGIKGKIIKALILALLFFIGIIIGFVIRRGIHEISHRREFELPEKINTYAFTLENCRALQEEIQAANIQAFLKNYSSEPHIAGKPSSKKYVENIVNLWKAWGIENVRVEKFEVLLSYPSSDKPNTVHLQKENGTVMKMTSEVGDDELHSDLRPYLAYSPENSAKGKLVYANYGRKEDFEYLVKENIPLNGSIIIMRMGKLSRANKVKFAEEYNAAGVLLYPDPADYVNKMKIYPDGLGLPGDSVIRGSLNLFPGDPQSPLQAATENAAHLSWWKLQLPKIPVQPISYNNAQKFMSGMAGAKAPSDWVGKLNITYNLGPGHYLSNHTYLVKMEIFNQLKEVEIHNVIGNIKGKFEPDRYVIMGNHHDSWTNGSGDPGVGLAAFMEVVRSFGHLKQTGWQPSRTLVFACWDAEEFGMIGSTEWLQHHEKELHSRAIAYINTNTVIEGKDTLLVRGSPLLQQAVQLAVKYVHFPPYKPADLIHDENLIKWWMLASVPRANRTSTLNSRLSTSGSNSDCSSFMYMNGISSVQLQFVNKDPDTSYYLYHSAYDNFDAVKKFIDPNFEISETLAQFIATLGLLLTDSFLLPMKTEDYGTAVVGAFQNFSDEYKPILENASIYLDKMSEAVEEFARTCKSFHYNFTAVNMEIETLGYHEYNDRALELERAFITSNWNIYQLSYRHAIFGPHPYNMEEGVAFPQLLTAILKAQSNNSSVLWNHVNFEIAQVIAALQSATMVLSSDVLTSKG